MLPIDPDDLIVAVLRKRPTLLRAVIPPPPLSAVMILLHPPVADIDITAARLAPHRIRSREVHPERPIFVLGQQRIADKSPPDFFTREYAPGDAAAWTRMQIRLRRGCGRQDRGGKDPNT
jgi:hypothetical protein